MNFCLEFLQELWMLWGAISNTRNSVSSDIQTLRSWLKRNSAAPRFFGPTFQCLDIWWNTLRCVWYIISFSRWEGSKILSIRTIFDGQVFAHSPSLFLSLSLSLFISTQYLSTFDAFFFLLQASGNLDGEKDAHAFFTFKRWQWLLFYFLIRIDAIHKWLPIHYSFVLVQISLPSLVVMC